MRALHLKTNKKIIIIFALIVITIAVFVVSYRTFIKEDFMLITQRDSTGNIVATEKFNKIDLINNCQMFDLEKRNNNYISRLILYCVPAAGNNSDKEVIQEKFLPFNSVTKAYDKKSFDNLSQFGLNAFLFLDPALSENQKIDDFQVPIKWKLKGADTYTDEIIIKGKKITIVWGLEANEGKHITVGDYKKELDAVESFIDKVQVF